MDVWLVLALAGPLLGFLWWLGITLNHGFLYLRGFRDKLSFFISPWMPRWYVLLKHINGEVEQFYELRAEKSRGKYLLRLGKGELIAVMEKDPDEAAVPISIWDARGPPGMPSPYGLAWRAIVGWAFAVYIAFLAFDFTALGHKGPMPTEGWLSLLVFTLEFSYLWQLFAKMNMPMSKYLGLVVVGVNPPHLRVVPELSVFDPRAPVELLGMLARKLEIVVPKELTRVIEKLKERLGTDEAVASWIAAQAEMAVIWRKNVAEIRDEMRTVKTVARRMIRTRELRELSRPSLGKIMIWLLILGVGIVIGYVFGSSWAISAHPPPWYSNASHAAASTAYAQQAAHAVTPAPMPSPPIPPSTHTPVTPANPPAPPTTTPHHPPVSPAPAPPPPTNTTRG